jgi:hypothetical protein
VNSILDIAAEQLAVAWLSDVPAGDLMVPLVARGVGATLKRLHQLGTSATRRAQDPDRWARAVFAIPRGVASRERAGEHVARLILGWLPEELRTCGSYLASVVGGTSEDEPQPPPATAAAPDDTLFKWRSDLLSRPELKDADAQRIVEELVRTFTEGSGTSAPAASASALAGTAASLAAVSSMAAPSGPPTPAGAGSASRWDQNTVERMLRRLARRWGGGSRPALRRMLAELNQELTELPVRLALATALATSEIAVRALGSTMEAGSEVHRELQQRYQRHYSRRRIVYERYVFRPGQARTTLSRASLDDPRSDYMALRFARISPFSLRGNVRDDLVDFTEAGIWEIKPVADAPLGVIQESYYRVTYNFATIFFEEQLGWRARTSRLAGGRDWADFAPHLLRPFPVTVNGQSGVARPFCLDALPGLVLYLVVRGLSPQALAALEAAMLAIMLAFLKAQMERLGRVAEAVARIMEELQQIMTAVAKALAALIVVVAVVVALVIAAALLAEAAAAALGLAAALVILLVAGAIVVQFPDDSQRAPQQSAARSAAGATSDPRATINFGACSLANFPIAQLPKLESLSGRMAQQSWEAGFKELLQDSVPVSPPL